MLRWCEDATDFKMSKDSRKACRSGGVGSVLVDFVESWLWRTFGSVVTAKSSESFLFRDARIELHRVSTYFLVLK